LEAASEAAAAAFARLSAEAARIPPHSPCAVWKEGLASWKTAVLVKNGSDGQEVHFIINGERGPGHYFTPESASAEEMNSWHIRAVVHPTAAPQQAELSSPPGAHRPLDDKRRFYHVIESSALKYPYHLSVYWRLLEAARGDPQQQRIFDHVSTKQLADLPPVPIRADAEFLDCYHMHDYHQANQAVRHALTRLGFDVSFSHPSLYDLPTRYDAARMARVHMGNARTRVDILKARLEWERAVAEIVHTVAGFLIDMHNGVHDKARKGSWRLTSLSSFLYRFSHVLFGQHMKEWLENIFADRRDDVVGATAGSGRGDGASGRGRGFGDSGFHGGSARPAGRGLRQSGAG
jgi:hypothetical protein